MQLHSNYQQYPVSTPLSLPSLNIMEIVPIDFPHKIVRNVILVSKEFFQHVQQSSNKQKSHYYIQIAHWVYPIFTLLGLKQDQIGINRIQKREIEASIFKSQGKYKVAMALFFNWKNNPFIKAHFEIAKESHLSKQDSLNREEIIDKVKQTFSGFPIKGGQSAFFEYRGSIYKATLIEARALDKESWFGTVNNQTEIELCAQQPELATHSLNKLQMSEVIKFSEGQIEIPQASYFFHVQLNSLKEVPSSSFIITKNDLRNSLFLANKEQEIMISKRFVIYDSPHHKISCCLQKVNHQEICYNATFPKVKNKTFKLCPDQIIYFKATNNSLIIASDQARLANQLMIKVDYNKEQKKPGVAKIAWLNREEIITKIQGLKKTFCQGENLPIFLEKCWINVTILEGKARDSNFKSNKTEGNTPWVIDSLTKIRLFTDQHTIPIVKHDSPLNLAKVKFDLLPNNFSPYVSNIRITEEEVRKAIHQQLVNSFAPGQILTLKFPNYNLKLKSKFNNKISSRSNKLMRLGRISTETKIEIVNLNKHITIIQPLNNLQVNLVEALNQAKLAGLPKEFMATVEEMITERCYSQEIAERGTSMRGGLLLAGPPGCGKTQAAKFIASLLGCSEENGRLTIIKGPEVFKSYVGDSEKSIRRLFKPANKVQHEESDGSKLHIILLDEVDSVLGTRQDKGCKVDNKVVNQFLACMQKNNNLIIIGTTNRAELIDSAVLRAGRMEKTIMIDLPSETERHQIFAVHLAQMSKNERLKKLKLLELAKETEGCTGADIERIVREASLKSLARARQLKIPIEEISKREEAKVSRQDFLDVITLLKKEKKGENSLPSRSMYN